MKREKRPDFSGYLAHFTSDCNDGSPKDFQDFSAFEKLVSILDEQTIVASTLPWVNREAVCFTECPWASLIDHAEKYSPYGIGFSKPHVFAAGGGPVYYVRSDHWEKQNFSNHIKTFTTPFWPEYRPPSKEVNDLSSHPLDYTHEREWRVPQDFTFEIDEVEFVIVDTYEDINQVPEQIREDIGTEKFLAMDTYRKIESLWPVHNVAA